MRDAYLQDIHGFLLHKGQSFSHLVRSVASGVGDKPQNEPESPPIPLRPGQNLRPRGVGLREEYYSTHRYKWEVVLAWYTLRASKEKSPLRRVSMVRL